MGAAYYRADITEIIEKLLVLSRQVETCMNAMVAAGLNLQGFDGRAAQAYRMRFTPGYATLQESQIAIRKNTFKAMTTLFDAFHEVDNSPAAVIHHDQLDKNDAFVTNRLNPVLTAMEQYNKMAASAAPLGAYAETLPKEDVQNALDELIDFNTVLRRKLESADEAAAAAIETCFGEYHMQLAKIAAMFDGENRDAVYERMARTLSPTMVHAVAESVEEAVIRQDVQALEYYLRENEAEIRAGNAIPDYEAFIRQQLDFRRLSHEYAPKMNAFYQKFDPLPEANTEKQYPGEEARAPQQDLLFLTGGIATNALSLNERKKILHELNRHGTITDEKLGQILGEQVHSDFTGFVMDEYHHSGKTHSFSEAAFAGNTKKPIEMQAVFRYLTRCAGVVYHDPFLHPPVNSANL